RPAVPVSRGPRLERRRIRPRARLGQRVAAERLAARQSRQPPGALLCRPPLRDRLAHEAVVHRDDAAHGRVGPAELLHDEAVRDRFEAHAAVLGGKRRAEKADLRQLPDDRTVHRLRAIPVAREWDDLAVAELARRRADKLLLVAEFEVHAPFYQKEGAGLPAPSNCVVAAAAPSASARGSRTG